MRRRPWTRLEDDILEEQYGKLTAEAIGRRLEQATGHPRSAACVVQRAGKLNIDHRTNQAGVTLTDAARDIGVSNGILYNLVDTGKLKTFGQGKVCLITYEDLERIRALYPPAPASWMTSPEARRKLGYGSTQWCRLLRAGVIKAVKRGHLWYVDAAHVEQLAGEMKRKGLVNLDLGKVRALDAERAKVREYGLTVRNPRRAKQNRQIAAEAMAQSTGLSRAEVEAQLEAKDRKRELVRTLRAQDPEGEKTCGECLGRKPVDAFNKASGEKGGRGSWCRPCMSAYMEKWRPARAREATTAAVNPFEGVAVEDLQRQIDDLQVKRSGIRKALRAARRTS